MWSKIYREPLRQAGSLDPQDTMTSREKRKQAPIHIPAHEITQPIKSTSVPAAEPRWSFTELNLSSTDKTQHKEIPPIASHLHHRQTPSPPRSSRLFYCLYQNLLELMSHRYHFEHHLGENYIFNSNPPFIA